MHPTFLAKLKPQEVREPDGTVRYVVDENAAKKLGSYVNPPFETYPDETTGTASRAPRRRQQKQKPAPAAPSSPASAKSGPRRPSGGMFSSLFASTADSRSEGGSSARMKISFGRLFGSTTSRAVRTERRREPPAPQARRASATAAGAAAQAAAPQAARPTGRAGRAAAPTPARQSAASGASLMNGATPTIPTGSFSSRWGAVRQGAVLPMSPSTRTLVAIGPVSPTSST